jgi:hypothetical protein
VCVCMFITKIQCRERERERVTLSM